MESIHELLGDKMVPVLSELVGDKMVPVLVWPDGSFIHLMPYDIKDGQKPAEQLQSWLKAWMVTAHSPAPARDEPSVADIDLVYTEPFDRQALLSEIDSKLDTILGLVPSDLRQHSFGVVDCVKRLRESWDSLLTENHLLRHGHKEADTAKCEAENENLRAERDRLQGELDGCLDPKSVGNIAWLAEQYLTRAKNAEAERDRLRDRLREGLEALASKWEQQVAKVRERAQKSPTLSYEEELLAEAKVVESFAGELRALLAGAKH